MASIYEITKQNQLLEEIIQEIETEARINKEVGRGQCEGMARAVNIIRNHVIAEKS